MSTKSATGFEWSVKLFGASYFNVGIASHLKEEGDFISEYDQNAILYCSWLETSSCIKLGTNVIHSNLAKLKNEDVIRFRFKPHAKKLVINLKVRVLKLHINLK